MNQIEIKVNRRPTGKQYAKKVRREGLVPGVFYTKGEDAIPILADPKALKPIVYTSETKIVNLTIEDDNVVKDCVLKDVTFDPVTEALVHFDFQGIIADKKMTVEVPVVFKGQAIGVREGGVLQQVIHKLAINCLPKDIPNHIELDISSLKIGKSIFIKDLHADNFDFILSPDTLIVSIAVPRVKAAAPGTEAKDKKK
jgi:large subunit ribosomal protein L25